MKIEIVQRSGSMLEFYLEGEDHTFASLLVEELRKDKHVKLVGYSVDHPILNARKPRIKVVTDGKISPKVCLEQASQRIFDRARVILEAWKGAIKE